MMLLRNLSMSALNSPEFDSNLLRLICRLFDLFKNVPQLVYPHIKWENGFNILIFEIRQTSVRLSKNIHLAFFHCLPPP